MVYEFFECSSNIPSGLSAYKRVYYSLAVWRFKPIWVTVCGFIHIYLAVRLRDYRAVAWNKKFSSRFSVFACFCGGYSNRVKRLRRLSGNFVLLKASLFNEGLLFRARPSQSGLPSESPAMWAGVRSLFDIRPGFKASKGSRKHVERWRTMWRMSI